MNKYIAAALGFAFCFLNNSSVLAGECSRSFDGQASFYADRFHGRRTASGARLNNNSYTCAHRTLPFGTKVLVRNPSNGSSCIVTVTDRGPWGGHNRVIDLTRAAARKLGISGVGKVVCFTGNVAKGVTQLPGKIISAQTEKRSIARSNRQISLADSTRLSQ